MDKLNQDQKKAIEATDGPIIILAGAGSGKTRVLVQKVLHLVFEKNINPQNILMVTFTNKAAGEMLERIKKAFGEKKNFTGLPITGTFHAISSKILRRDGRQIGISPHFQIYDTQDQVETIKEAFRRLDLSAKEIKPKSILQAISQAKNQMVDENVYMSIARGYFQQMVSKVYPVYQEVLAENDALDFDDLLLKTIYLFKSSPEVLSQYQDKFQYILIDEYQDTNEAQYQLTKLLSGKHRNICIVGDFSQSIYSFRGADFRNLQKFKKDFPDTKEFSLSQNYRSTQKILDAAYSIISKNTTHPVLSIWTENRKGEELSIFQARNEHDEAEFIVRMVNLKINSDPNFSFSDVAVLYRMNAQSRALEETFLHNSTPYILVGGTRFYERREVKDVLAYLAYLANPKNKVALKRIEKIGKRRRDKFITYFDEFGKNQYVEKKNTIEIMDEVLLRTSYLDLYDILDPEDKSRLENIKELRSVAIEFKNLVEFLENVSLVEQQEMPDRPLVDNKVDAITLMTMHAAKGLEFKMVFIVGLEEGLFPHSQSLMDTNELEEERRLCYVGITRAKEKLYLCFAKRRLFFGQTVSNSISRFIYELPEDVLEKNYIDRLTDEPSYL